MWISVGPPVSFLVTTFVLIAPGIADRRRGCSTLLELVRAAAQAQLLGEQARLTRVQLLLTRRQTLTATVELVAAPTAGELLGRDANLALRKLGIALVELDAALLERLHAPFALAQLAPERGQGVVLLVDPSRLVLEPLVESLLPLRDRPLARAEPRRLGRDAIGGSGERPRLLREDLAGVRAARPAKRPPHAGAFAGEGRRPAQAGRIRPGRSREPGTMARPWDGSSGHR